jgi:catalase
MIRCCKAGCSVTSIHQKSRLGTANFHQIPINAPKCPYMNFQRDGMMQTQVFKGRANYEPNSLNMVGEEAGRVECPVTGFTSFSWPGRDGRRRRQVADTTGFVC